MKAIEPKVNPWWFRIFRWLTPDGFEAIPLDLQRGISVHAVVVVKLGKHYNTVEPKR